MASRKNIKSSGRTPPPEHDPVLAARACTVFEDELITAEEEEAVTKARDEVERGEVVSHAEIRRLFGI